MLAGNGFSPIAIVSMHNFQVALDVHLVEQTAPEVEFNADCLCDGIRQLIRILQRADCFAYAYKNVQSIFCSPLLVNILDDDNHTRHSVGLISKGHAEDSRPDVSSFFWGVEHLATRTHRLASHSSRTRPLRWIEQAPFRIPRTPARAIDRIQRRESFTDKVVQNRIANEESSLAISQSDTDGKLLEQCSQTSFAVSQREVSEMPFAIRAIE